MMPQEGKSSKILLNARFFKVGLGNRSKNLYLCIVWLICGIRYIVTLWSKNKNNAFKATLNLLN